MLKKWLIFCLCLTGCSMQETEPAQKPAEQKQTKADVSSESMQIKPIAENLQVPWSIQQHGEAFFISERPGTISVIENGEQKRQEVFLSSPLSKAAEAGLLGFALKPDFENSRQAYAYYTYDEEGVPYNRIVVLETDGSSWQEINVLIEGISSGPVHHGGRLEIGPDGILYATIGDASTPSLAQDDQSLNGKILRIDQTGQSSVYTKGHRNPQGLAWSENGTMYASEHGQSGNDEINVVEEGKNYGWPEIEGTKTAAGLETPLATSGSNETWAPSGMTWHREALYVAALRGQAVLQINPESGAVSKVIEGYGRIRDVFSSGDYLYFVTNNTDGRGDPKANDDKLYRVNWK